MRTPSVLHKKCVLDDPQQVKKTLSVFRETPLHYSPVMVHLTKIQRIKELRQTIIDALQVIDHSGHELH